MTKAEKIDAMSPEELEAFNRHLDQMGCPDVSICENCEEKGCSCTEREGSWCSLMSVVGKVALETDGVVGLYNLNKLKGNDDPADGDEDMEVESTNDDQDGKFDIMSLPQVMHCQCNPGELFRQRHATFLQKLERQFRSFPPNIHSKLIHWFMSKHMHGYEPFMLNPDYDPKLELSTANNFPVEFYGHTFCSNAIRQAHHEYGEMAYSEGGPGCNCHGI